MDGIHPLHLAEGQRQAVIGQGQINAGEPLIGLGEIQIQLPIVQLPAPYLQALGEGGGQLHGLRSRQKTGQQFLDQRLLALGVPKLAPYCRPALVILGHKIDLIWMLCVFVLALAHAAAGQSQKRQHERQHSFSHSAPSSSPCQRGKHTSKQVPSGSRRRASTVPPF